ncbi:PVC-type heme-binding CxxCH protein [Rubinisphaera margarita]|uniref:PVC-type heme-binding CxxCH protein n=1 Tax=Rubinisphaera margarita TaxID=2909586 RepID=UPI001EE965F7|nr:PVC-type heme-binding CxxCH protein [Rubinisphaera margarita]MCG6156925.1 c-type cytochrome [Rubinisphaera margarita]
MNCRGIFWRTSALVLGLLTATATAAEPSFPEVINTQPNGEEPTTPQQAAAAISVPDGFRVTLFAGEPDVSQPISMEMDDRGRVWVAECYTYGGRSYDNSLRDRIVILEDVDGDGEHDKRQVFWDQGNRLTSVLPGTNGCWILNDGTLSWLSDKNGDDRADGEPQVFLEGFDKNEVGHNIVNGLMYGPTGWIYGRHGIQATSVVGRPGATLEEKTSLNCSIWRFHPRDHRFELVTEGTTNPWGLDYNEYGDFFFTNNVIGHAWHAIPGAHFKRMYGADSNPHFYELIDQHADHYHWDATSSKWSDSRDASGVHGELGGGHSHCGGMIYLGDNWPPQYRGQLFMCNTHGRRVNCDAIVRHGAGYRIEHRPDFLFANQPWFRGVGVMYGPDGGVYVSDWTDLGECHDSDGVHRTSGRIYKVTYGRPALKKVPDLAAMSDEELFNLQTHDNDWFCRHARRLLSDRYPNLNDSLDLTQLLPEKLTGDTVKDLRLLWTCAAMDWLYSDATLDFLEEEDEYVRSWAIRLIAEDQTTDIEIWKKLIDHARTEQSPYVRLTLSSTVHSMPIDFRLRMAEALLQHDEDTDDHDLRLILWYGIEPAVEKYPGQALDLTRFDTARKLRTFIARRLLHEYATQPEVGPLLVSTLLKTKHQEQLSDLLQGMTAATRGVRQLPAPPGWSTVAAKYGDVPDAEIQASLRELSLVFGDGRAIEELFKIVTNDEATPIDRISALNVLADRQPEGLLPALKKWVNDRVLDAAALTALARFDDAEIPELILSRYGRFRHEARTAAIETLCSRPAYAEALLKGFKNGRLGDAQLSASQARQIAQFEVPELTELLTEVWGTLNQSSAEKQEKIASFREALTEESLAEADLSHGRALFDKTCSTCHKFFGEGKPLAPDLTGGNRKNLDYLLENIVTPSAIVPNQYRMSTFVLNSGRVINGVIRSETGQTVVVQTEKDEIAVPRDEIDLVKPSNLSLMPEGLLDRMSSDQIRDLIAYLQGDGQVEPAGQ